MNTGSWFVDGDTLTYDATARFGIGNGLTPGLQVSVREDGKLKRSERGALDPQYVGWLIEIQRDMVAEVRLDERPRSPVGTPISTTKPTTEMDMNELVDWARGYLLVELGGGRYQQAVWMIVQQTYQRAHMIGVEAGKEGAKRGHSKLEHVTG